MSYFLCPSCGERSDIFGHGGARQRREKLGVPFLGEVPLHMDIRIDSDDGKPIVASSPDSAHAQIFREHRRPRRGASWRRARRSASSRRQLAVSPAETSCAWRFEGGERSRLSAEMLRVMSPSAEVQGHSPEQRVTVGGKRNVTIKELAPVGNYAVRIVFDDGHDTGLFAWSYLQTLDKERDKRWAEYLSCARAARG